MVSDTIVEEEEGEEEEEEEGGGEGFSCDGCTGGQGSFPTSVLDFFRFFCCPFPPDLAALTEVSLVVL